MQKLEIKLKASKQFFGLNLFLMLGAMIIVLSLPVNFLVKLLLLTGVISYASFNFYYFVFLKGLNSPQILKHDRNGWSVITRKGEFDVILLGDSTVTQFISILRFRYLQTQSTLSCIIFQDMLPKQHYRQLQVRIWNF